MPFPKVVVLVATYAPPLEVNLAPLALCPAQKVSRRHHARRGLRTELMGNWCISRLSNRPILPWPVLSLAVRSHMR